MTKFTLKLQVLGWLVSQSDMKMCLVHGNAPCSPLTEKLSQGKDGDLDGDVNERRVPTARRSLPMRLCRIVAVAVLMVLACFYWPVSLSFPRGADPHYSICRSSTAPYPDLLEAGAEDLMIGLNCGLWTSVDLVKAYTLRIHEVQPILNTVTEINPDAISIAQTLDAERAKGNLRGPLHGIPLLIKNNIATMDKMNNTSGSFALLGATVPRDATVVAKLRAAGIVILGKTNLSQWAEFRGSNTSTGWSAHGGQTYGAYHPNMDPSGSSSGSGVASSIGLALATLGTETHGSIVHPSNQNSLVGIKPTVGLTSRALVIPISEHQDTVGPMARSVTDAAYILSIIAGKDKYDNYTSAQPFDTPPDYTKSLNISSLQGARIGVPRNGIQSELFPGNTSQPILDAFEEAIELLKDAGATIIDNTNFTAWDEYVADIKRNPSERREGIVLIADFITDLPSLYLSHLATNPENIHDLKDVLNFTQHFREEQYPLQNTKSWEAALDMGFNNSDSRFCDAYQWTTRVGGPGGVTGVLDTFNLDALIMPTQFSSHLPALAGLPVVTVPLGFHPKNSIVSKTEYWGLVHIGPNIPFGLSFMGAKWSEETLIGFAYAYEQRTHTRQKVKPLILPKSQLVDVINI